MNLSASSFQQVINSRFYLFIKSTLIVALHMLSITVSHWKWNWQPRVQSLNEAVCTSLYALEKFMNPSFLSTVGQTGFFNLDWATSLRERKLNSN